MAGVETKTKPRGPAPATGPDYDRDFYAWCLDQAGRLRDRDFAGLDFGNLADEIESMGKRDRRALKSSWRLLLHHLLKWEYQPSKRTRSWTTTITQKRRKIAEIEADSASLRNEAARLITEVYAQARRDAADETGLPLHVFPASPPYAPDFLRDELSFPGVPSEEDERRLTEDG